MSQTNSYSISSGFDIEILTLGKWLVAERNKFHEWTDEINSDFKRVKAGEVLTYFIYSLLSDDCSYEGRSKIRQLYRAVSNLENLVYITRDITNKFYRDHLNHSLKVCLLAKAISTIKPFKLSSDQIKYLLLSCLFHDIAYPLFESVKIFNTIINTLKDCYFSAEFYRSSIEKRSMFKVENLSELIDEEENIIKVMMAEMNHGLLSSMEFASYLNNPQDNIKKYKDVIKSIAIHDSSFISQVNVIENPILGILIIADELQDWGRPSPFCSSIIPRIEDFELLDGKISGKYLSIPDPNFSVFKQICGKNKNFRRLKLDSKKIFFELIFEIDNFLKINIEPFSDLLIELYFNLENKKDFEPCRNVPFYESSTYEKILYGINVPHEIKMSIYELLHANKLKETPPLKNYNLYINEKKNEVIITKLELENINQIIVNNNEENKINTYIKNNSNLKKCYIKDEEHDDTKNVFSILITIIRYINYLNYYLSGAFNQLSDESYKIEGSCNSDLISAISKKINKPNYINEYKELKINNIIQSVRKKNFFLIH